MDYKNTLFIDTYSGKNETTGDDVDYTKGGNSSCK